MPHPALSTSRNETFGSHRDGAYLSTLACRCMYCRKQLFTACDVTNPHTEGVSFTNIQEALYGHRTGARLD